MEHLVLIVLGLHVGMIALVLGGTSIHLRKSLSAHIAQTTWATGLGRWTMCLMHVLLIVWLWTWAVPVLHVAWDFVITFMLACTFGALSGIVPFKGREEQMRLHDAFVWMYAVLILMLAAMLFARAAQPVQQVILAAITTIQAGIFFLFFSYRPSRAYFLPLQVIFLVLFDVALLTVTYL